MMKQQDMLSRNIPFILLKLGNTIIVAARTLSREKFVLQGFKFRIRR